MLQAAALTLLENPSVRDYKSAVTQEHESAREQDELGPPQNRFRCPPVTLIFIQIA